MEDVLSSLYAVDKTLHRLALTQSERNQILGGGETPRVSSVHFILKGFFSASKLLQRHDFTIADARDAFDFITMKNYQKNDNPLHYLFPDDPIVYDVDVTNGLVKIINGDAHNMSISEQSHCEFLLLPEKHSSNIIELDVGAEDLESYFQAHKKRRASASGGSTSSKYIKCNWIPCTTREIKALLPSCSFPANEYQAMFPKDLVDILTYLRVNREYWGIETFGRALRQWTKNSSAPKCFLFGDSESNGFDFDDDE